MIQLVGFEFNGAIFFWLVEGVFSGFFGDFWCFGVVELWSGCGGLGG
jgi:hypothetical protein